ncbi:PKD domain-containing protein [Pontiellaceae bacterium B12219]|nr:PKD domain-containing protein [Pontiellaceae bacterium B12219]
MKSHALVLTLASLGCALFVQGGTFVQNVEFPETGLIIDQRVSSGGVAPIYISTHQRGAGQSFVLTNSTSLSAITIQKNNSFTVSQGGTNDLALWIGEVTTNGVPTSTNYTGLIDISGQSFPENIFCSVNLDSPVVLPAGRYAFQMQFTTEDPQNNFSLLRSTIATDGDPYADGGIMYGVDVVEVPFSSSIGSDDLVFGLHSSPVSTASTVLSDPSEVSLFFGGESGMQTGTVAISYFGETDVDLTLSITDESHAGAFSVLSASSLTLVDPNPSNTVVEFGFDNSVAELTGGQSATGLLNVAWNDQASGSGVVTVPISVGYIHNEVITLVPDASNSDAGVVGTTIDNLISDPFVYSPLDPTATVPALAYTDGFHGGNAEGVDVVLSFTLSSAYTTVSENPVIVMDLWGRNGNLDRDNDIDVILYNGDYSTPVGTVEGIKVADSATDPYARGVINTLPVGTTFDRVQIIGHDSSPVDGNKFTLTEVRLAAIPGEVLMVLADISASATAGAPPLEIIFDGSGSSAPEGIISYSWDFGDGNTATGVLATNTFAVNGPYTVELTVMGASSNTAMDTLDIQVDLPVSIVVTTAVDVAAEAPTASSVDLAQTHYLSSSSTGFSVGDETLLFNGEVANDFQAVSMATDASVMINFDVSTYFAGYDITGISTYFGSNSGGDGRANQGYRVVVTYVDDSTATLIGADLWEPAGYDYTTVSFSGTNGTALATGVKSVTIDKIYPANAAAYGDFTNPV